MNTSGKFEIAAMEGCGFYNRNSSMQELGIEQVMPLWQDTAKAVSLADDPLTIVDYGSSQGRNSMVPIGAAIGILRTKVGLGRSIEVFHVDLPTNDFTSLFQVLAEAPNSYLINAREVFPAAIGRSYFEPILPPERVHLGWNSWTLHWMRRKPVDAPDHVFAALSASPEVRASVSAQQAEDWRCFLESRSKEFRPGGKLLCLMVGKATDRTGWEWIGSELWSAVRDMGREGLITQDEQTRVTLPTATRSAADLEAPFVGGGSFAGFKVDYLEILKAPDPFWSRYVDTGDKVQLGRDWSGVMRAICGPTFAAALDDHRNGKVLVDELFARFASRVASNPQVHEHFTAVIVLTKES